MVLIKEAMGQHPPIDGVKMAKEHKKMMIQSLQMKLKKAFTENDKTNQQKTKKNHGSTILNSTLMKTGNLNKLMEIISNEETHSNGIFSPKTVTSGGV